LIIILSIWQLIDRSVQCILTVDSRVSAAGNVDTPPVATLSTLNNPRDLGLDLDDMEASFPVQ